MWSPIHLVLLLATCAIAFADDRPALRILGGRASSIIDYPYLVSIRVNGQHLCGGAIISEEHILTASHCIVGHIARPYLGVTVVSGTDSLLFGGQSHQIKGAYGHASYSPSNIKHDIGILVLASKMTFNDKQKAIALPTSNFPEQSTAYIAGFGKQQNNDQSSPILRSMTTQIVHPAGCEAYGIIGATPGQICGVQIPGKGTCQGDSGGPLVANNQVVGIVSHGTDISSGQCGVTPDIYTDVFYYISFINDIIINFSK